MRKHSDSFRSFHLLVQSFSAVFLFCISPIVHSTTAEAQIAVHQISEAGPYDIVTIEVTGPVLDESSGPNPFADYRLSVAFSNGREEWTVPGYFAACADAADSSCTRGSLWRAHFIPYKGGQWEYQIDFRTGANIVASGEEGRPLAGLDGATGKFTVGDKARNLIRARGILQYLSERYYRWQGSGRPFFNFGPDSPENTLAYVDFDSTPDGAPPNLLGRDLGITQRGLRKSWEPHLRDYDEATARPYLWAESKGKAILGMFKYLHDTGVNSVGMLVFNAGGDDKNVFPHLLKVSSAEYSAMAPQMQWTDGVHNDRYDVSKLAQWQRALSYADSLGLQLHFRLQEVENNDFMDSGRLGRERRIFLREMLARFNHFLAVKWNLGEENKQSSAELSEISRYIASLDTYDRPLVVHTYPEQKERYRPLLGGHSALTGTAMQSSNINFSDIRPDIIKWSTESRLAGRQWVIGYAELGGTYYGAPSDYPVRIHHDRPGRPVTLEEYRRHAIWNALTAGAEGIDVYYGFLGGCGDLDCEDHRSRARVWSDGVRAVRFFEKHIGTSAFDMSPDDRLTLDDSDYVFAAHGQLYLIFVTSIAPVMVELYGQSGRYSVQWYDPANDGELQVGTIAEIEAPGRSDRSRVDLGQPPSSGSGEWVILVKRID